MVDEIHVQMFTAELYGVLSNWEQYEYPSRGNWIVKYDKCTPRCKIQQLAVTHNTEKAKGDNVTWSKLYD